MILPDIKSRMRAHLYNMAKQGTPITYQALAVEMELTPPKTIHQVTVALEVLMAEDVAAGRPMIAALVISRSGTGLPAIGFFEKAARLGRFRGDLNGSEAAMFHKEEFAAVVENWESLS